VADAGPLLQFYERFFRIGVGSRFMPTVGRRDAGRAQGSPPPPPSASSVCVLGLAHPSPAPGG